MACSFSQLTFMQLLHWRLDWIGWRSFSCWWLRKSSRCERVLHFVHFGRPICLDESFFGRGSRKFQYLFRANRGIDRTTARWPFSKGFCVLLSQRIQIFFVTWVFELLEFFERKWTRQCLRWPLGCSASKSTAKLFRGFACQSGYWRAIWHDRLF